MINKKIAIVFGMILLIAGVTYAAGVVLFGGNSNQDFVIFTSGSQNWTVPNGVTSVEVLVVAGGGGGGSSASSLGGGGGGGGGGAGGLKYFLSYSVIPGETINVTVGAGGAPGAQNANQYGSNGQNSSFGSIIATGGGGGSNIQNNGLSGGSGGGAGYNGYSTVFYGGGALAGEGNIGGNTSNLSWAGGAGGGGAGGIGGDNKANHAGGNGGLGLSYSINGTNVTYAAGADGGYPDASVESTPNSGNGGVGAYSSATAYAGGSGIVIIKSKPMIRISSFQSGLVGHWPLDSSNYNSVTERVTDKTPYSNHGTNYGATLTTDRMGHSEGAMSFGTSSNWEYIQNPITSVNYNLTLSAWISPIQYPSERSTIILGMGAYYLSLAYDGSLQTYWYGRNPEGYFTSGAGTVSLNSWSYCVAVWNSSNVMLYVNGVLKSISSNSNVPGNTASSIIIGAESFSRQFNGSLADVRVYNRALSEDEIKTLYDSYNPKLSSGSLQKGLVLDMPLTSTYTTGVTPGSELIKDKTPYSNNGQNYGATVGSDYISFDGNNDYIDIGKILNDVFNGTNSWTVVQWVNDVPGFDYYPQFSKGIHTNGPGFTIHGSDGRIQAGDGISHGFDNSNMFQEYLPGAGWKHTVVTYDGEIFRAYVDGNPRGTYNWTYGIGNTSDYNMYFGHFWGPYGGMLMSGVRIYNRALSVEEIKLLYDKGR